MSNRAHKICPHYLFGNRAKLHIYSYVSFIIDYQVLIARCNVLHDAMHKHLNTQVQLINWAYVCFNNMGKPLRSMEFYIYIASTVLKLVSYVRIYKARLSSICKTFYMPDTLPMSLGRYLECLKCNKLVKTQAQVLCLIYPHSPLDAA